LFLDAFLNLCAQLDKIHFEPHLASALQQTWLIKTEESTDYGRLDIILRCPEARLLIAIENKIDAAEQARQLERYCNWLYQHKNWNGLLIFLTLDGRSSNTAGANHYVPLSYRREALSIVGWLHDCRKQLVAPRLIATLDQYCEVLEGL
jgi:hypothetical protein